MIYHAFAESEGSRLFLLADEEGNIWGQEFGGWRLSELRSLLRSRGYGRLHRGAHPDAMRRPPDYPTFPAQSYWCELPRPKPARKGPKPGWKTDRELASLSELQRSEIISAYRDGMTVRGLAHRLGYSRRTLRAVLVGEVESLAEHLAEDIDSGLIRCTHCGRAKLPEEFARSRRAKSGRVSKCRECYREEYRAKHPVSEPKHRVGDKRSKIEETVYAYVATGNLRGAASQLGVCCETVRQRLRKAGIMLGGRALDNTCHPCSICGQPVSGDRKTCGDACLHRQRSLPLQTGNEERVLEALRTMYPAEAAKALSLSLTTVHRYVKKFRELGSVTVLNGQRRAHIRKFSDEQLIEALKRTNIQEAAKLLKADKRTVYRHVKRLRRLGLLPENQAAQSAPTAGQAPR